MHLYFAGIIVGIILLQTAIIAPAVFKNLEAAPAGTVIRSIFPKFFVLLAILGGAELIVLVVNEGHIAGMVIAGISLVFPIACRLMIPATNRAKDEGDSSKFKLLHKLSVWFTVTVLLGNLALPFI